jgi:mersacidin/lichenicidin family type 2 lantibiotic
MSNLDIVRAWKDEEYCSSLSDLQRASLPENPAGLIELTDAQLAGAGGGQSPQDSIILSITLPICPTFYLCSITFCVTFTIGIEQAQQ